jgi:hypothetical protein
VLASVWSHRVPTITSWQLSQLAAERLSHHAGAEDSDFHLLLLGLQCAEIAVTDQV